MGEKVTVIGAGSWGTALASVLVENGHEVLIWCRSDQQADEINNQQTNEKYLPNTTLPEDLTATSNLEQAVHFSETLLFVLPTNAVRSVAEQIKPLISVPKFVIHATKGIERDSDLRISEVLADVLADKLAAVVALSGPSHAEEVMRRDITSITAASDDVVAAERVQSLFMNSYFRVYTNTDVIGVEIGAALKNIIAIGSGIITGLGYGDNARAALITRGLAEITRLGVKMGADPLTFSGLSGVGDLVVTCMSPHSRNFKAGQLIGQGYTVEAMLAEVGMVVEGFYTTIGANQLADKYEVDLPIARALYRVLYEEADPQVAIERLMNREGKSE
ncbi:NAD(P)H-dependent glycerol-3-phosphate dehydrogenase [Dolosigranulum savutiense]|uniref:Glycerol-3-phosphate dehydrogenase [NAD(P)+] n=1 Tax=Dolosigranulum savutiense TaxID=3110288 RepID=A0AB74U8I5_9LACT